MMARALPLSGRLSGESGLRLLMLLLALALLVIGLLLPLATMLIKSVQDRSGDFVGLANFARYVQTPALVGSIINSVSIALISTLTVVSLAFLCAYGITRTCMPSKRVFRMLSILPLLAPSLLPAISLVYLFGNQGIPDSSRRIGAAILRHLALDSSDNDPMPPLLTPRRVRRATLEETG